MLKRPISFCLSLALVFATLTPVFATESAPGMLPEESTEVVTEETATEVTTEEVPAEEATTADTTDEVTSDDVAETVDPNHPEIYLDGVLLEDSQSTLINGTTYIAFTSLVRAIYPDAVITWENSCAVATVEGLEISAQVGASYLYANGRYLYVPDEIQLINNKVLVPVRTLAQTLGVAVWWDNSVRMTVNGEAFLSADEYYDDYNLALLTAIIYSESGNQPLDGKIAVGNVVLNRVASSLFPSTIYDVLVEPNQFYGTVDGILARTPNAESIIAAKLCLEGASILSNAYWFNGVGKTFWASENKSLIAIIGDHAFYG